MVTNFSFDHELVLPDLGEGLEYASCNSVTLVLHCDTNENITKFLIIKDGFTYHHLFIYY